MTNKKGNDLKLEILKIINVGNTPVGASWLSKVTNYPSATIGRVLFALEEDGYLEKISNKGRMITLEGKKYIEQRKNLEMKLNTASEIIELSETTNKKHLLQVLKVRKLLEGETITQACKNIDENGIAVLERIMLEHLYSIKNGGIGNEQDLDFHLKIAECSNNETIYQILKLILTENNTYTKFSYVSDEVLDVQIKQHNRILTALKEHNQTECYKAMIDHLSKVEELVEQYIEK